MSTDDTFAANNAAIDEHLRLAQTDAAHIDMAAFAPIMHDEPHDYGTFICDGVSTYGPNPYNDELYGDTTPEWMCGCQRYEAAMDV